MLGIDITDTTAAAAICVHSWPARTRRPWRSRPPARFASSCDPFATVFDDGGRLPALKDRGTARRRTRRIPEAIIGIQCHQPAQRLRAARQDDPRLPRDARRRAQRHPGGVLLCGRRSTRWQSGHETSGSSSESGSRALMDAAVDSVPGEAIEGMSRQGARSQSALFNHGKLAGEYGGRLGERGCDDLRFLSG